MNKDNGFLAVRIVLGLSVLFVLVLWASAQLAQTSPRKISGPEDLRQELMKTQAEVLPQEEGAVSVDAGEFIYDGTDERASDLACGLISVKGSDGKNRWPVILFEDPLTRETVFVNGYGDEVGRIAPPPGYDPLWVLDQSFPEGVPDEIDVSLYDPACVTMTAWLLSDGRSGAFGESGSKSADTATEKESPAEIRSAADVQKMMPLLESNATETVVGSCKGGTAGRLALMDTHRTATNAPSRVVRVARVNHTVYVDFRKGKDTWTGVNSKTKESDGPKRTIRGGLAAVRAKAVIKRMVVRGGVYREDLNVRGLSVSVQTDGNIVLTSRSEAGNAAESSGSVDDAADFAASATGTVARVFKQ